jgi:hypothetical protein
MPWPEEITRKVWQKGNIVPEKNDQDWRKDECGALMYRKHYGNHNSQYGWEIEKISYASPSLVSNFRPLQWQNNVNRDESIDCIVTAAGDENVIKK